MLIEPVYTEHLSIPNTQVSGSKEVRFGQVDYCI
jgi:hypothetical protein